MEIGAKLFYKCQFEVELADLDRDDDVLWQVVSDLGHWVKSKRYPLFDEKIKLTYAKVGTRLSCEHRGVKVTFRSALHEGDGQVEWAGVLEEDQPREKVDGDENHLMFSPRKWITELSFKSAAGANRGVFSLILSYQDRPGFLGLDKPTPPPSIPRLITIMTDDERLYCGKSGLGLESMVTKVTAAGGAGALNAMSLWKLVMRRDREYPIVYIAYDSQEGRPAVDPDELARSLYPNALIAYACDARDDAAIQRACQIPLLRCRDGAVRIYAPHPEVPSTDLRRESGRHRFFSAPDIRYLRQNFPTRDGDPMIALLRQALSQDVGFYEERDFVSLDHVLTDRQEAQYKAELADADARIDSYHAKLEELRANIESSRKAEQEPQATPDSLTAQEWQRKLDARDNDVAEALDLAGSYEAELNDMKGKVHDLRATLDSLRRSGANAGVGDRREALPADLPAYFEAASGDVAERDADVLSLFEALYPDRIVIADRVRQNLKKVCVTKPALLWQAMMMVCTTLWRVYAQAQPGDGNLDDRFNNAADRLPGFTIALSEGAMTHKDRDLMALRRIVVNGRDYDIEPHLKKGVKDDDESIRIYYAWDAEARRIVIGHVGRHLLNCTGKKGLH